MYQQRVGKILYDIVSTHKHFNINIPHVSIYAIYSHNKIKMNKDYEHLYDILCNKSISNTISTITTSLYNALLIGSCLVAVIIVIQESRYSIYSIPELFFGIITCTLNFKLHTAHKRYQIQLNKTSSIHKKKHKKSCIQFSNHQRHYLLQSL